MALLLALRRAFGGLTEAQAVAVASGLQTEKYQQKSELEMNDKHSPLKAKCLVVLPLGRGFVPREVD